jgi:hypothetical protein
MLNVSWKKSFQIVVLLRLFCNLYINVNKRKICVYLANRFHLCGCEQSCPG